MKTKEKTCSNDKILNPKTNRCVLKNGLIGKKLIKTKITETKVINKNKCDDIFIDWSDNSCYLDSLLVAFFNTKDKIIEDLILNVEINDYGSEKLRILGLKIQEELTKKYKIISNQIKIKQKQTCVNLRKLLNTYYKKLIKINPDKRILFESNDNWTTSQLDVFELFEFILTIFKIPETTLKIQEGANIIYSNFKNLIPIDFIYNKKVLKIQDIYPTYTLKYKLDKDNQYKNSKGKKQSYFTKKYEILKGNKLFISIYRNQGEDDKSNIKVIPCDKIKLKENSFNLYLTAIILHYGSSVHNGHYICLYKCDNNWYEYNDMDTSGIKKIGKISEIIKNVNYTKNIVGLVYSKLDIT